MPTKTNPKHIKSTGSFPSLNEELIHLNQAQDSRDSDVDTLQEDVANLDIVVDENITRIDKEIDDVKVRVDNIDLNVDTVKEVVDARDIFGSLDERLDSISKLNLYRENLKLTTTRDYEYDAVGNVLSEEIKGDINYKIVYNYDSGGNITGEEHFHNGETVGTKTYIYHPTMGYITKVISDKADHMELVYNDTTTVDLGNRIEAIEQLGLEESIDDLYNAMLAGPYDGKKLTEKVDGFSARLESVEQLAFDEIGEIINLPDILGRIEALEMIVTGNQRTDKFIVSPTTEYKLSGVTEEGKIKVYVEGIMLHYGVVNDYILLSDNRTLEFHVNLMNGMEVVCEYY